METKDKKYKNYIIEVVKNTIEEKKRLYQKFLNMKTEEDLLRYKKKNRETKRILTKEKIISGRKHVKE